MTLRFTNSAEWAASYRASACVTQAGEDSPGVREAMLLSSFAGQIFGDEVAWMDEEGDTYDDQLSEWLNSLPPGRSFDVLGLDWWGVVVREATHPEYGPIVVVQTFMHSHGGGEPSYPNCWAIFRRL